MGGYTHGKRKLTADQTPKFIGQRDIDLAIRKAERRMAESPFYFRDVTQVLADAGLPRSLAMFTAAKVVAAARNAGRIVWCGGNAHSYQYKSL